MILLLFNRFRHYNMRHNKIIKHGDINFQLRSKAEVQAPPTKSRRFRRCRSNCRGGACTPKYRRTFVRLLI